MSRSPSRSEVEALKQKVLELISQKPEKAAIILTEWVHRPSGKWQSRTETPKKKAG